MFRDFLSKNSRSLSIILILFLGWLILYIIGSRDNTKHELEHPKVGQVYVFQDENFYAPMRLDSIGKDELFMRNYEFLFADAIPEREQILNQEFDSDFFAIYDRKEIENLYEEGRLVRIYKD